MAAKYLTTGQAASLCSVSPDTVLKWIRGGSLPARRTAGGHHRISADELKRFLEKTQNKHNDTTNPDRSFRYCWEFNGNGSLLDACRECAVFQMRAQRCYEVIKLAPEALHRQLFCKGSCQDCDYFRLVHEQVTNVLVVSDDQSLTESLSASSSVARFNLEITDCEYTTSAVVNRFRPDFAVVDCQLGEQTALDICRHLSEDPRIPLLRLILAANEGEFPDECERDIFARISRPFSIRDINACIDGIDVQKGQ